MGTGGVGGGIRHTTEFDSFFATSRSCASCRLILFFVSILVSWSGVWSVTQPARDNRCLWESQRGWSRLAIGGGTRGRGGEARAAQGRVGQPAGERGARPIARKPASRMYKTHPAPVEALGSLHCSNTADWHESADATHVCLDPAERSHLSRRALLTSPYR